MASLKERMESADTRAQTILVELRDPQMSEREFDAAVHEYMRCKFLLDPTECTTDDLFDLAEISIEKMLLENDRSVKLSQASATCTDQSSTDVKKVLLSLSLQRALDVSLPPEESARTETVSQLASILYRHAYPQHGHHTN